MSAPIQIAQPSLDCKCCGGKSLIFGVVDFAQNLGVLDSKTNRPSKTPPPYGIPVYYHRCTACGFLFTTFFDEFTREDFSKWVYTEDYGLIDMGYGESRAADNCKNISRNFPGAKTLRVLDYGGGTGKLAQFLKESGFGVVDTFDPFVPEFAKRPEGTYDMVVAFEVLEHTTRPVEMFADIEKFVAPNGLVFATTQLQPKDVYVNGTKWWYLTPRTGHASIYTAQAILSVVSRIGLNLACFNDQYIVLWRGEPPEFARHLFQHPAKPA